MPELRIFPRALILVLVFGPLSMPPAAPEPGEKPVASFGELERGFAQPDMRYAPFAFWFWDAPVDPQQTARMAREMCKQRLNPGYAHPRGNLPREQWLSPLWFEGFGAALREAEGAHAYLGYCDEYGWPSGQAAGRVLEACPELRATSLRWDVTEVAGGASVQLPASLFTVAAQRAETQPTPAAPPAGAWIWDRDARADRASAYFRRTIEIPAGKTVRDATLAIAADNRYTLFVNGAQVGSGNDWYHADRYDLSSQLHAGRNVLAVRADNDDDGCGLIAGLQVTFKDGAKEQWASDARWRSALRPEGKWSATDYDDSAWHEATVVGANADSEPWGSSRQATAAPARIVGDSPRLIGEGSPFVWRAPAGRWRVYSFNTYFHAGDDGGRVNYLDRHLPGVFLPIAHEPYARAMKERMGRSIPGVFVDNEGDYGYKLAWSRDLPIEYVKKKGVDMRPTLPLLIDEDETGRFAKVRWDWYDVVSDVYTDNYFGSVNRWLAARGMYDISNLWEESLILQANAVGDFFKVQREVTLPGTDALMSKPLDVHDFKETASVTEFENRRFQCEILGVAGWQMTPILMKEALNSVTAWGVSHIVPHGINLNRKLETIPYPPDWFESNPYWRYLHLWTDFARRASYVNSHGHAVPDVLLINPMDSIWALHGGGVFDASRGGQNASMTGHGEMLDRIEQVYSAAIRQLAAERIEYLIADRHYLSEMRVENAALVRGPFRFSAVVLPPMVVLPREAAQQIVAFAEAGGSVFPLGELPTGSPQAGLVDPEMASLMRRLTALPTVHAATSVPQLVAGGMLRPQVEFISGSFPMPTAHRRIDGRDFFWLVNNASVEETCTLRFHGARGRASKWDCETGPRVPVSSDDTPAGAEVALSFAPCEAFWLVLDPEQPAQRLAEKHAAWRTVVRLEGDWQVGIDPAVQPPPAAPRLAAPDDLLRPKGVTRPLAGWLDWPMEMREFSGFVDYRKPFTWDGPRGQVRLDLGEVKFMAEVWVNGKRVGERLWPPFVFDMTSALRKGENELHVRVGNLLCNAMQQHAVGDRARRVWAWLGPPNREQLNAGLFGPVVIQHADGSE